jgi:hypothetical protein
VAGLDCYAVISSGRPTGRSVRRPISLPLSQKENLALRMADPGWSAPQKFPVGRSEEVLTAARAHVLEARFWPTSV